MKVLFFILQRNNTFFCYFTAEMTALWPVTCRTTFFMPSIPLFYSPASNMELRDSCVIYFHLSLVRYLWYPNRTETHRNPRPSVGRRQTFPREAGLQPIASTLMKSSWVIKIKFIRHTSLPKDIKHWIRVKNADGNNAHWKSDEFK